MEFELIDDMRDYERPEVKDAQTRRIGLISDTLRQELCQRGMYRIVDNNAAEKLIFDLKGQQDYATATAARSTSAGRLVPVSS